MKQICPMFARVRRQQVARLVGACALLAWTMGSSPAVAEQCGGDAGASDASFDDAAAASDAGACFSDAGNDGPSDGSVPDATVPDAPDGSLPDAATSDAAVSDGGPDGSPDAAAPETTKACSCDIARNRDGLIHVCTGSFQADVCAELTCDGSNVRARRCPEESVKLCCNIDSRGLYTNLYEDCTHPNCESGFRVQCGELGGTLIEGACETPDLPDDEDTEISDSSSCSLVGPTASGGGAGFAFFTLLALHTLRRVRRKRG